MVGQPGFFDLSDRYAALSAAGDPLERLTAVVDFEVFRGPLIVALRRSDLGKGGRPPFDPVVVTAAKRRFVPRCRSGRLRACLKMGRGPAVGEFWVGQGGERRGRPPTVCSARTNAVQAGKTRRPEGLGGKGPLAALLVGHRPLRVCFLLAPCQSNPSLPNRTPPHFQTGSKGWKMGGQIPVSCLVRFREGWPISVFKRETVGQ